jgi:hypothetical protein
MNEEKERLQKEIRDLESQIDAVFHVLGSQCPCRTSYKCCVMFSEQAYLDLLSSKARFIKAYLAHMMLGCAGACEQCEKAIITLLHYLEENEG